jgi:hypothetical protein
VRKQPESAFLMTLMGDILSYKPLFCFAYCVLDINVNEAVLERTVITSINEFSKHYDPLRIYNSPTQTAASPIISKRSWHQHRTVQKIVKINRLYNRKDIVVESVRPMRTALIDDRVLGK